MPNTRSQAFKQIGATVTLSATTTSSNIAIDSGGGDKVRVVNTGLVPVFIDFGMTAPTATIANSVAVGAGESVELFKGSALFVGCITASSTATVYVTPGS
jgi:hypothetical protein